MFCNFVHECKAPFQIKLLSFKSFSPVIFSLISLFVNAASIVIIGFTQALGTQQLPDKKRLKFSLLEHVSWMQ